jgi:hypothetical protein
MLGSNKTLAENDRVEAIDAEDGAFRVLGAN